MTDTLVVGTAVGAAQVASWVPGLTLWSAGFAALWLGALAVCRTRGPAVIGGGAEEYRRVITASCWTFGAFGIVALLTSFHSARGYLVIAATTGLVGLPLTRWFWRRYVARSRSHGRFQTSVLAVGDRAAVAHLAAELTRDPRDGFRVVGVGIPEYGPPRGEHLTTGGDALPIVGGLDHVVAAVVAFAADTVAIAGTEHFGVRGIHQLLWELEPLDIDLVVSPGVTDVAVSRLAVRSVARVSLVHVGKPQYRDAKRFQKRALDTGIALAALIVTAPILLAAAVAVRLSSPGPVFYRAQRVGIDGTPFTMLKLRTMVHDADGQLTALLSWNECDGPLFKMRRDPRVTPVGRILRRLSIDELPQFVNVLRGDMSVVGPRPPLPREVDRYDGEVRRRMLVKPGITGLWQVSGRARLSWEETVRLDISYVENWSTVLDLVIIAKTLRAVLLGRGAY